jgi:hypothetical protein
MKLKHLLITGLAGLLIWSCTSPTNSNEDEPDPVITSYLSVEASPDAIPADGTSQTVIFTEFRQNGEAVPDSTRIILLNTIGTLGLGELFTMDGIAIDTLTSDTVVALGMIYAIADGLRDSVEIAFEPVEAP